MNTFEQQAALDDLKSDIRLTVRRYEEIIALRMYLLDIRDALVKDAAENGMDEVKGKILKEIERQSRKWGKQGDCV